jgi:uncharacterized protein (DUF608 family)
MEDKQLDPDWVESLVSKGSSQDTKIRGTKQDGTLKYIGMPVGGIGCGTVYLGGDGRLWVWDIFNQHHEGVVVNKCELPQELKDRYISQHGPGLLLERDGANYVDPPTADRNPGGFKQGFGMQIGDRFLRFEEKDWADVQFTGDWPIGRVSYRDSSLPVEVDLQAFSPFIPLNLEDSSLPLTCMSFTVRNKSDREVTAALSGLLENAVGIETRKTVDLSLKTTRARSGRLSMLQHGAEDTAGGESLTGLADYGTMALGVLDPAAREIFKDGIPGWESKLMLKPGESKTVTFLLTWNFPNIYPLWGFPNEKRHYSTSYADAAAVARYAADNYDQLHESTEAWVKTWYDSTLPEWFMDRTVLTANTLQTANCFIFGDGQFWSWEGIGACEGTCTHVWGYAQAVGRLFPSIERNLREATDFDYALDPETGLVAFRGVNKKPAVDGQAGIILRTLREHQVSADDTFLKRVWPKCKFALQGLMNLDLNSDGILDGAQHNTLDSAWYGEVAWLSGHYLAAVRAGEQMAREMGDLEFAEECRKLVEKGSAHLTERLYDPERGFFINRVDPNHPDSVNSGTGCHIDQVFGQSWAFQVGLDRVLPAEETQTALRSLWKHNFLTDVDQWRMENKPGRWYAVPGEGGLLMCTFPTPDWDYTKALGVGAEHAWSAMYFNECMTGFEYQVASHMVYENEPDLIQKGLAITRAIHDRYSPVKRNPYNEIECSDHYGRAAASYGVFLAACGFEYHGPEKRIGFAPRISPEDFRAPFTAAEGWGTYQQEQKGKKMRAIITVNSGSLSLRMLVLQLPDGAFPKTAKVKLEGKSVPCHVTREDGTTRVHLKRDVTLKEGESLSLSL